MLRRVTYSRNLTLSLSRTCASYCKYCSFQTHQPHLREPEEVERLLSWAARRNVKEVLVITGEAPDSHPGVAERLAELGFPSFLDYVVWTCERALGFGLLPHTNLGTLGRDELTRLREVTASQGMMLESLSPHVQATAHAASPRKEPSRRLQTLAWAGELRIPFTTGILVGLGETHEERLQAFSAIADLHRRYGHIQEVIVQNFIPHPRYYGRDVGEIAAEATERFWRTGVAPAQSAVALPEWCGGEAITLAELKELIAAARKLLGEIPIQIPPNLAPWLSELIAAGANDLGGLSANGDHVSPEHPFPSPYRLRGQLAKEGVALAERLCVYPRYIDPQWLSPAVLDVIKTRYWTFIPRGRLQRRPSPYRLSRALFSRSLEKAADGRPLSEVELTSLFAERDRQAAEEVREAADRMRAELAGEVVTFVVNRNINISNICTVGCAFCGFGQSRRSPEAYEHDEAEFVRRVEEAIAYGATELCIQSGIHPDWELEDYLKWLRLAKRVASEHGTDLHLHAYSPMEISHICDRAGLPPREVLLRLKEAGLGSTPGTAAEILDDGVRARISPNKLPVARWLEIIEASHSLGIPSTATVMFGHLEEPWELARHMVLIRSLQERTGGITEFVPLSFIPFQTLLGRTHGIEELPIAENLRHTAVFRLALGRTVRNLQASWVKMGLAAATEALRWGVNDLGGTLMEESISRMAGSQHGTKLDPEELVAAAHAAGRPAAERTTLYKLRRHFPLAAPAAA